MPSKSTPPPTNLLKVENSNEEGESRNRAVFPKLWHFRGRSLDEAVLEVA